MRRRTIGQSNTYKESWQRLFMYAIVFFLVYLVLMTSVVPKRYNFIEGDIASEDIKAPIDIIDEEATKEKEKEIDIDSYTTTTTAEPPSLTDVYFYFKEFIENASKEAEKFHAYNANKGWTCLPNWKATADLWIARIGG